MNLIELENLVKGAPDEYLTNEVKQPTGKIPPFLALSEIQRRKDMRDRYMGQKNEGVKPTIAEQLTDGIGSLSGTQPMQGAPVPTPSAMGVPSSGAPPVATGGAPMPTPPGMPQGFARGGVVGYADGGAVTPATPYLDATSDPQMQYQFARGGVGNIPLTVVPPPVVPARPPLPEYKNKFNMTPAQVMLGQLLSDPNSTKVPDAINYDELIAQAGQGEKDIREEARKSAIGSALVKLGAGLSAGNMGAGFNAAGDVVTDIMGKGRTEASAERRMAQQLILQSKEGQRQQAMEEFKLGRDNLIGLAQLESDSQRNVEERAYQSEQLAVQKSQAIATAAHYKAQFDLQLASGVLNEKQYELTKFATTQKLITENTIAITGKPPDKSEMDAYRMQRSVYESIKPNSNGQKLDARGKIIPNPVNPEVEWTKTYRLNFAEQAKIIAPALDYNPNVFSPTPPAADKAIPTDDAIAALKKNPDMKIEFDKKYGSGMADKYLPKN